jgi:hypothetical protein
VRRARLAVLGAFAVLAGPLAPALAQQDAGASSAGDAKPPSEGERPLATMTCERVAAAGRVRCEAEARVPPGLSISWGDVVLRRVPPFAAALRGRVGPEEASVREPGLWRWPFALVARGQGAGDVEGQVRVVLCRDESCVARDVPVAGKVEVGR